MPYTKKEIDKAADILNDAFKHWIDGIADGRVRGFKGHEDKIAKMYDMLIAHNEFCDMLVALYRDEGKL